MKTEINWHVRFTQQAGWTVPLRKYLYEKANLLQAGAILEVGCGTGAVLAELPTFTNAQLHALDLDHARLLEACEHAPSARFVNGNALALPYPAHAFDVSLCHFLLLWVSDPVQVLREMRRVTCSGGAVLVMAEPDYSHRIDQPQELARLGELQTRALQQQGADPAVGLKLPALFDQAGIKLVETGILKKLKNEALSAEEWELEWSVLEYDLAGRLSPSEIASLKKFDIQSRLQGERSLFVPTHFAWGRV